MPEPGDETSSAALREQLALYRLLSDAVPVAMAYYAADGLSCRFANSGYCRMFGFSDASIIGRSFSEVIGPEAAALIQPQVDRMLNDRLPSSYEREIAAPGGASRWVDVHLLPHVDANDQVVGAFVLISDITRHRQAEAALRQSEERLAKFMHASAEGIVFHRQGLVTDVNPPLLNLIGYSLEQMLGRPTLDFVDPNERQRVAAVIRSGAEISYQSLALHRDGTSIPVEFIVRTMRHQDETLRMTIVRDMRDRLAAQQRIHYLAHHDALTGLPNRHSFIERIDAMLADAVDGSTAPGFALFFIDLDHFKRVNDSLGHLVGDELLKTIASRITACLRSSDLVARFGGDEFVVLIGKDPSPEAVLEVAHKLLQVVSAPLQLADCSISVTPSIGVAMHPRDGDSPEALLKHADTAMYSAKAHGRAGVRFFEAAMAETAYAELALEGRLAQAVQAQEFVLHFQPQLTGHDGRLAGVEALLRWQHPMRGLVGPEEFITLAEARRLMLPIGRWVLQEALHWAARWRHDGLLDVPVAMNLSSTQFESPSFVAELEQALAQTGCAGAQLELELTEHMLMSDLAAVRTTLQRLRGLGVRIAVDDFGTGYTSLRHLKDLPLDRLKIDRSFVVDLPQDTRSAAIAQSITQLARGLGLQVVADGVDSEAQRRWLHAQGCDTIQGQLAAPPMPAEVFETWLQARPAKRAAAGNKGSASGRA